MKRIGLLAVAVSALLAGVPAPVIAQEVPEMVDGGYTYSHTQCQVERNGGTDQTVCYHWYTDGLGGWMVKRTFGLIWV